MQGAITSLQSPSDTVRRDRVGQSIAGAGYGLSAPEHDLPVACGDTWSDVNIGEVLVSNAVMSVSNLPALEVSEFLSLLEGIEKKASRNQYLRSLVGPKNGWPEAPREGWAPAQKLAVASFPTNDQIIAERR